MMLGCTGLRRESEVQETVQVCVVLVQYRVRVTTGFQLHTFWRFQYSTILSPTPSLLVKKIVCKRCGCNSLSHFKFTCHHQVRNVLF